jgi:ribonuclease HI
VSPGPALAELLRFLAEHESLQATLSAFPSLDRAALRERLLEAAAQWDAAEPEAPRRPPESRASAPLATASPLPPNPGQQHERLRVHSDGAARGNPGLAGAGAVLSTPDGAVVERLGKFLGTQTNNVAEYTALLLGLARAKALGAREVEVFADSELMIRQLEGRYQVKAPGLKPLYEQARALLRGFSKVRLQHVPREQNKDADEMSNRAIDERM